MNIIRSILVCTLLATLVALVMAGAYALRQAAIAAAAVPGEIAATRSMLARQIAALRIDALAEIDSQASALRKETLMRVDTAIGAANSQLSRANQSLDAQFAAANRSLAEVAGVRSDLKPALAAIPPALAGVQAAVKDAQDSWDDSYPDLSSLLQSAEVTTTQAAHTMEAVAKAAPAVAQEAVDNGRNVAGITADVHAITAAATKPKSFWGKVWAGITVASRFAGVL